MEKTSWVYILASALRGRFYIGVTNDLVWRGAPRALPPRQRVA